MLKLMCSKKPVDKRTVLEKRLEYYSADRIVYKYNSSNGKAGRLSKLKSSNRKKAKLVRKQKQLNRR